jgi:anti-sigma factor RsiW
MERMPKERVKDNCTGMESRLADLLLDPDAAPAKVQAHVDHCDRCREELAELRATMDLLNTWEGPEPSPYFLSRFDARMREERQAAPADWPASWIARLRARFTYGPAMHVRPLAAMALTVVLLLGGGTYLGITDWDQPAAPPGQATVVHDLQTLDNNAQLLDQLEAMSSSNENGD